MPGPAESRRSLLAAGAIIAGLLVIAQPATGRSIDLGPQVSSVQLLEHGGGQLAVWIRREPGRVIVESAQREASAWTARRVIDQVARPSSATSPRAWLGPLRADRSGLVHVMYALPAGPTFPERSLRTSRFAGGAWTAPVVHDTGTPSRWIDPAGMTIADDGAVLAVWNASSGERASRIERPRAAEFKHDVWATAELPAWTAGRVSLISGRDGLRPLLWQQPQPVEDWGALPPGGPPAVLAERTGPGTWTATPVPVSGRPLAPTVWTPDGLHLIGESRDGYGVWGHVHALLAGGAVSESVAIPRPSNAATLSGFLAGPMVTASSVTVDARDRLVMVDRRVLLDPLGEEDGVAALWASTRARDGRWSVQRVDRLAEAVSPEGMVVDAIDRRTRVRWVSTAAIPRGCQATVFEALRDDDGRWAERAMLSSEVVPRRGSACDPAVVGTVAGSADALWVKVEGRLRVVRAARPIGTPAAAPELRPRTSARTWSDVRRARGIAVDCRAIATPAVAGICSASIVRAWATQRRAHELDCLEPVASGARSQGAAARTNLRFSPACLERPPRRVRFRVLVTFDAPGYRPASSWLTVTLKP